MEFRLHRVALMLTAAVIARGEVDQPPAVPVPPLGVMRKAMLEDGKPYQVAVGAVPTTILMPGPIEAFEGNNIATTPNTAATVYLDHERGTRFFSVKALLPGTADLNVVLDGAVYSFRFYYSENPTRTLTIAPARSAAESPTHLVRVTARRLYDLLQDAKSYFILKDQHPEWERTVQVVMPGKVLEYPGYRVVVDQVFRFDADDTLVFRLVFLNDTEKPLFYAPAEIALRIGQNVYWPSFAQVPKAIPPRDPARLSWEVSPDATSVEIVNPHGQKASLLDRSATNLDELGDYLLTARGKGGLSDSVRFSVRFPARKGEANPLIVAKGERDFGWRRVTVVQPEAGQNFGYVCYTGTADGRRADLSLQNDFSIVVMARATP